jgi:cytochrome c2
MRTLALALVLAAAATAAQAADAAHGKQVFREQCGLCHAAGPGDGEAGQGPDLAGVVGRRPAGDAGFSYTAELKARTEPWTAATLDTFLANPQAAVPGTAMPVNLADAKERADVVAYLASVKK